MMAADAGAAVLESKDDAPKMPDKVIDVISDISTLRVPMISPSIMRVTPAKIGSESFFIC